MSFWEDDIDGFFLDFATPATWTPSGGEATSIDVIFDAPFEAVNVLTGEVDTTKPQCLVKSSAVEGISKGDLIECGGVTYYAVKPQPAGAGITTVILSTEESG
jgi:hypothetical protein